MERARLTRRLRPCLRFNADGDDDGGGKEWGNQEGNLEDTTSIFLPTTYSFLLHFFPFLRPSLRSDADEGGEGEGETRGAGMHT